MRAVQLLFVLFSNAISFKFFSRRFSDSRLFGLGGESITSNARSGRNVEGLNRASSSFLPKIVDTAISTGSFNTLVAALSASDLVSVLNGEGPFTVFAPNDAAFAKLPAGTVDSLLADIPKLKSILVHHVVSGRHSLGKNHAHGRPLKSLSGQTIGITINSEGKYVDNVQIVEGDILCKNGLIHIVDTVLLPK